MGLLESLDGQPPAGVGVVDIWDRWMCFGLKLDDCWVNMLISTIHVFFFELHMLIHVDIYIHLTCRYIFFSPQPRCSFMFFSC